MLLSKYVISAFGLLTEKAGLTSIAFAYCIIVKKVSLKCLFSKIKTRTTNEFDCLYPMAKMELGQARPGKRPTEVGGFQRFYISG